MRKRIRKIDVIGAVLLVVMVVGMSLAAGVGPVQAKQLWNSVTNTTTTNSTSSCVNAPGKFCWNGKNGADACKAGTTGTMLVIFNAHNDLKPGDFTITWPTGETDTYPKEGWINPGNSQDWHLTVTIVGGFPPQSMSLSYSGTLDDKALLTISGCNEGGTPVPPNTPPGTTTGSTTTTGTTTGQTTTAGTTTSPPTTTAPPATTATTTTSPTTTSTPTTTATTPTTTSTPPATTAPTTTATPPATTTNSTTTATPTTTSTSTSTTPAPQPKPKPPATKPPAKPKAPMKKPVHKPATPTKVLPPKTAVPTDTE